MDIEFSFGEIRKKLADVQNNLQNVVTHLSYTYIGGTANGERFVYTQTIALPDADAANFIAAEHLSDEHLVYWIEQNADLAMARRVIGIEIRKMRFPEHYRLDELPVAASVADHEQVNNG